MDYIPVQIGIAGSLQTAESPQLFAKKPWHLDISLFVETVGVMFAVILAVKILATSSVSAFGWFITPGILVAASLIPTAFRGGRLPDIGFSNGQIKFALGVFGRVCLVILPSVFVGLWLLRLCSFELPLRLVSPQNHNWVCWVLYQFMYVAVAEEVFFRGYIQNNILILASSIGCNRHKLQNWISIVLSAACFAVAHIIVQGQITLVLTFLPGLVLGWLFVRTRSLLAPILFHGLANTCYCLIAAALA
jgi:membrane protease YdiL (CAAX protease family)